MGEKSIECAKRHIEHFEGKIDYINLILNDIQSFIDNGIDDETKEELKYSVEENDSDWCKVASEMQFYLRLSPELWETIYNEIVGN